MNMNVKSNYDESTFTVSKDKIFNNEIENPIENPNEDYIDIFTYENLTLEYSFKSRRSALYLKKSDNVYELLFSSSIINGIENSSFYSKDNVYILSDYNHNTNSINKLVCISKKDFIKSANLFSKSFDKTFSGYIYNILGTISTAINSIPLIIDDNCNENDINKNAFKEYRHLFVKYESAVRLIPVSNLLNELLSNIHEYIATGCLDTSTFNRNYSELQNFKEICGNSISLLSSFLSNPQSTDLRSLCDSLAKNIGNIDNLLKLYLEDELNLQDKEKDDDSK